MRAGTCIGLVAAASAVVAGCSLLTSLDGLSGGRETDGGDANTGSDGSSGGGETGAVDGPLDVPASTGTFIVAMGGSKANVDQSDVYVTRVAADGSLGTWVTAGSLPGPRSKAGLAVSGSRFFLTGGNAPTVGIADTTFTATFGSDTLSPWSSSTMLPSVLFRHGSFEYLGDVYLLGGFDPSLRSAVLRTTPASDGTLGTFRTELSLPAARASAGVVRSDNHVYVIAGEAPPPGGGAAVATAAGWVGQLDATGSISAWSDVAPLPNTTEQPGIAATSSHVYVSGGYASGSNQAVVEAPIAVDGTLGSWTTASSMLVGRAGHRMVVTGGRLYAIGGVDGANLSLSSVEVADIASDGALGAFRQTTPLPDGRAFMVVAAIER